MIELHHSYAPHALGSFLFIVLHFPPEFQVRCGFLTASFNVSFPLIPVNPVCPVLIGWNLNSVLLFFEGEILDSATRRLKINNILQFFFLPNMYSLSEASVLRRTEPIFVLSYSGFCSTIASLRSAIKENISPT